MAIQIIGASRGAEQPSSPLEAIDVDLPPPGTAPAGKVPLGDELVRGLLAHPSHLVRSYALEQASQRPGDEWSAAIAPLIADSDPGVAADAIHLLAERKYKPGVDAIVERFQNGARELAAYAATALGILAPERLLEAVKQRGRLDDEAYAATAVALAEIASPEVIEFLDKALNRAGALSPERRGALFGACLLSGSPELANRVISQAIEDSKRDEQEGGVFPSRQAFAAVSGVPSPYASKGAGLELFDQTREAVEGSILPLLPEAHREQVEAALRSKRPGAVLGALAVVLDLPPVEAAEPSLPAAVPARRRGLLRALVARKDDLDALELKAAAVFIAAATQAAGVVALGASTDATSPALLALGKALEPKVEAVTLAQMSETELTELFRGKQDQEMRRVVSILTHERVRLPETLRRMARAIFAGGHAQQLWEAAAEVSDGDVHEAVLSALAGSGAAAEPMIVEALTRTPLEPKLAVLALLAANKVRSERIALALGRRFAELRELARTTLVRAILRQGDPRLVDVLRKRAFRDEPEELTWALLMQIHGLDGGPKLADALERIEHGFPAPAPLRVPLRCKRCKEELSYGFDRAMVDIETKDRFGDPAFVGDVTCKACGAEDQLEPTPEAGSVLTAYLLESLKHAQRGEPLGGVLVTPGQTVVHGKPVGFARALRQLDEDVQASPTSIRARLARGRLRLLLKRKNVEEDVAAVLEADPRAAEAHALRAGLHSRRGEHAAAMASAIAAYRLLTQDPPARIYDTDSAEALKAQLEVFLVDLEKHGGGAPPAEIDLTEARARYAESERRRQEAWEAARRRDDEGDDEDEEERRRPASVEAPRLRRPEAAGAFRRAGRNDPCPCGSGKKFKKCHGRAA